MSLSNSPSRLSNSQKIRNIFSGRRNSTSESSLNNSPSRNLLSSGCFDTECNSPCKIVIPKCHQCNSNLIIDNEKELFLAIKCTCMTVPYYYCTPECHRTHWITLNTRGVPCTYYDFADLINIYDEYPLIVKLQWTNNIKYVHNLYHYVESSIKL